MKAIGVTGTRTTLTDPQREAARALLLDAWHRGTNEFHHGCCEGADEILAWAAHEIGFRIVEHPPLDVKHISTHLPPADVTRPPRAYLVRDVNIVKAIVELVACPRQDRSREPKPGARGEGTWWTVRYAENTAVPVWIVWPDGERERR